MSQKYVLQQNFTRFLPNFTKFPLFYSEKKGLSTLIISTI